MRTHDRATSTRLAGHIRVLQSLQCNAPTWTNRVNSLVMGDPWNSAMVALLSSAANMTHGPIIQPRLVGQAMTSEDWRSACAHASAAALMGDSCDQGMALGVPGGRRRERNGEEEREREGGGGVRERGEDVRKGVWKLCGTDRIRGWPWGCLEGVDREGGRGKECGRGLLEREWGIKGDWEWPWDASG